MKIVVRSRLAPFHPVWWSACQPRRRSRPPRCANPLALENRLRSAHRYVFPPLSPLPWLPVYGDGALGKKADQMRQRLCRTLRRKACRLQLPCPLRRRLSDRDFRRYETRPISAMHRHRMPCSLMEFAWSSAPIACSATRSCLRVHRGRRDRMPGKRIPRNRSPPLPVFEVRKWGRKSRASCSVLPCTSRRSANPCSWFAGYFRTVAWPSATARFSVRFPIRLAQGWHHPGVALRGCRRIQLNTIRLRRKDGRPEWERLTGLKGLDPSTTPSVFQNKVQPRCRFGSVEMSAAPHVVKWPSSATARPSMSQPGSPSAMVQPLWPWWGQVQLSPSLATSMPMTM